MKMVRLRILISRWIQKRAYASGKCSFLHMSIPSASHYLLCDCFAERRKRNNSPDDYPKESGNDPAHTLTH